MVRLTVLAVSSVLALSTVPVKAQLVPVVPVVPAPVYHDHDWRVQERERAYHHERHRLRAEERDLDARRRVLHEQRRHEGGKRLLRPLSEHAVKRLGLVLS